MAKSRHTCAGAFSHHDILSIVKDASVFQIETVISLLGEVKSARTRLENIFNRQKHSSPGIPLPFKGRSGSAKNVKVSVRGKGKKIATARPGTLRALVHSVLKGKGPTKSSEVASILKANLGKKAGSNFATQINQILINKRDPSIKKVGRGIYAYQG